MLNTIFHNVKLIARALTMTIKGERVRRPQGKLIDWLKEAARLSEAALKQADADGIDAATRKTITTTIDGRKQSLQTVLTAVHYHATDEYPYLLSHRTEHSITAIYALNMNDSYAVTKMLEDSAITATQTRAALSALADHLHNIPPSNDLADAD